MRFPHFHTTRNLARFAAIILAIVATTSCYDRFGEPTSQPGKALPANVTMDLLVALCPDHATLIPEDDLIISGLVTSSDEAGNFYRSLMLQDATGAVEILGGPTHLFRDYPPGSCLSVQLKGLAMGRRFGVVQIGRMPPTGDFAVDHIGTRALLEDYVKFGGLETPPVPLLLSIAQLQPQHAGQLVSIQGLSLLPSDSAEQRETWAGYRTFEDASGRTIRTYTSNFARFASVEVPTGPLKLTGILQRNATTGDRQYTLMLRDESDCMIEN